MTKYKAENMNTQIITAVAENVLNKDKNLEECDAKMTKRYSNDGPIKITI